LTIRFPAAGPPCTITVERSGASSTVERVLQRLAPVFGHVRDHDLGARLDQAAHRGLAEPSSSADN
jgi:hypothetical protein